MRGLTKLDLSQVPIPDAVEVLDYETIVQQMRDVVVERFPAIAGVIDLESEPVRALIEVYAYRELLLRARVNDGARANMLAYATGTNLDNLAAFYGFARAVGETDDDFRARIALAPEAFAAAGPAGAYRFFAKSADPVAIKDVSVDTPSRGQVLVTILGATGDGMVTDALRAKVFAVLDAETVRPLTDVVSVRAPRIVRYRIEAGLYLYPGPEAEPIRANAAKAAEAYAAARHKLGQDITLSGLHAALHQAGVQRVVLRQPTALPININMQEVAFCEAVTVTVDGRAE